MGISPSRPSREEPSWLAVASSTSCRAAFDCADTHEAHRDVRCVDEYVPKSHGRIEPLTPFRPLPAGGSRHGSRCAAVPFAPSRSRDPAAPHQLTVVPRLLAIDAIGRARLAGPCVHGKSEDCARTGKAGAGYHGIHIRVKLRGVTVSACALGERTDGQELTKRINCCCYAWMTLTDLSHALGADQLGTLL